ncbi:MAG: YabP/YqfC family sporulation protein [Clostridia bacterium]|nr:YabP/YqfC family sporulation protein [Clostridia bacterium]
MALLGNMLGCIGIGNDIAPYPYRFYVFGTSGAWIEGIKGVKELSAERISLVVHGGIIEVTGKNLRIIKFVEGEMALGGEVVSVSRADK